MQAVVQRLKVRPLDDEERALLEVLANRKIEGPIARSTVRDRLRRLGCIEAFWPTYARATTGQAQVWRLTERGRICLQEIFP